MAEIVHKRKVRTPDGHTHRSQIVKLRHRDHFTLRSTLLMRSIRIENTGAGDIDFTFDSEASSKFMKDTCWRLKSGERFTCDCTFHKVAIRNKLRSTFKIETSTKKEFFLVY